MVYFMKGLESGLIKIGITEDLNQRVKQVGEKVEILAALELCDKTDRDLEMQLHERFQALAVFGEWFADDGSIGIFVNIMLAHGVAMTPARAFEWSEERQWRREVRSASQTEKMIDAQFVEEIHAATVKRARARKLAQVATEDYEARLLENA